MIFKRASGSNPFVIKVEEKKSACNFVGAKRVGRNDVKRETNKKKVGMQILMAIGL